jgi:integrase
MTGAKPKQSTSEWVFGLITAAALATASDAELVNCVVCPPSLEAPAGSRFGDAIWWWPKEVAGHHQPAKRRLDFRHIMHLPILVGQLKRYIVAVSHQPALRPTGLTAWRNRVSQLGRIFARLPEGGIQDLRSAGPAAIALAYQAAFGKKTAAPRQSVVIYLSELSVYCARGILPNFTEALPNPCNFAEVLSQGRPLQEQPEMPPDEAKGYRAFPDRFTNALGCLGFFYICRVMPELLRLIRHLDDLGVLEHSRCRTKNHRGITGPLGVSQTKRLRQLAIAQALSSFEWRNQDGSPLKTLRVEVASDVRRGLAEQVPSHQTVSLAPSFSFPPRSVKSLHALWAATMVALMQVLLFITGGRVSEIQSLEHDCLRKGQRDDSEELWGHTQKPSAKGKGAPRSWPLPPVVAEAIRCQLEIARIASGSASGGLWLDVRRQRRITPCVQQYLRSFTLTHGLEPFCDEVPVHPHRFRKTIARIVVLTLLEGVTLLQELLGHSNLEATLIYLLSDPDIRADLAEAGMEIRNEIAFTVVQGGAEIGGRGGELLRKSMQDFFDQLEVPQAEREQRRRVDEFVTKLLIDGTCNLKVIAPGILCVKPTGAVGACGTDVIFSRCQATCRFYAQLPWTKKLVEANVDWIAEKLGELESRGKLAVLERNWWVGQLRDQLGIFQDVRAKWAIEPRVVNALRQAA